MTLSINSSIQKNDRVSGLKPVEEHKKQMS